MKSIYRKALGILGAICLISLVGCNEKQELEWDLNPSCIQILVVDKDGNNLMNPDFAGNMLANKITMEYNGKVYTRLESCTPWPERTATTSIATKSLAPSTFSGLQTSHPDSPDAQAPPYTSKHILVIGFWEQDDNFERQNFVINWGDGTSSEIGYSQEFSWKYNRKKKYDEPDFRCRHWLDGKEISGITPFEGDCITIVK